MLDVGVESAVNCSIDVTIRIAILDFISRHVRWWSANANDWLKSDGRAEERKVPAISRNQRRATQAVATTIGSCSVVIMTELMLDKNATEAVSNEIQNNLSPA